MAQAAAGLARGAQPCSAGSTGRGSCCSWAPATTAATRSMPARCCPGVVPPFKHSSWVRRRTRVASPTLREAGGRVVTEAESALAAADLVIDGLVGIGASGPLRQPAATLARLVNDNDVLVVAVDVPSGVDASTGEVQGTRYGQTSPSPSVGSRRAPGLARCRSRRSGRAGAIGLDLPAPAVTALDAADVAIDVAHRRLASRASTPAVSSASSPAASSTPAPRCSPPVGRCGPAPAWCASSACPMPPTRCAPAGPRSSSPISRQIQRPDS